MKSLKSYLICEGGKWIGTYTKDKIISNFDNIINEIEHKLSQNENSVSFEFNGNDFTLSLKDEKYKITSGIEFSSVSNSLKTALTNAWKYSNGVIK